MYLEHVPQTCRKSNVDAHLNFNQRHSTMLRIVVFKTQICDPLLKGKIGYINFHFVGVHLEPTS